LVNFEDIRVGWAFSHKANNMLFLPTGFESASQ
jgi:hypothetical protein